MTLSEIIKLVAFVLGSILAIVAAILTLEWYLDEVYIPTIPPPNKQRVQNLTSHSAVLTVLERYKNLPESQKQNIIRDINLSIQPFESWQTELERMDYTFICLGEFHNEYTRQFLASQIFSKVKVDKLFLEATPTKLDRILKRLDGGRSYIKLLDADIVAVLNAVRKKNPLVVLKGIEETKQQQSNHLKNPVGSSRDDSITDNFMKEFKTYKRHVALFGALHCSDKPGWMFDQIKAANLQMADQLLVNIGVFGEHQDGPLEAFVYFLDEIGMNSGSFVIKDTGRLPPQIRVWFPLLDQVMLDQFQTIIVFRP